MPGAPKKGRESEGGRQEEMAGKNSSLSGFSCVHVAERPVVLSHPIAPVPSVCCTFGSTGLLTGHCPFRCGASVAACRQ